MASSTCSSVEIGESVSLARDSVIRTMASSWRTVIGIEERALAVSSAACTCLLIETKCDDNFSAASADSLGAHFLGTESEDVFKNDELEELTACSTKCIASSSPLESQAALALRLHDHPCEYP